MDESKTTAEYIDEEVVYMTNQLKDVEAGSEEQLRLAKAIAELQKANLEGVRVGDDWEAKKRELNQNDIEIEIKKREQASSRKQAWVNIGVTALSGLVAAGMSAAVTVWAVKTGLNFELTDTIGSTTARNVVNGATRI